MWPLQSGHVTQGFPPRVSPHTRDIGQARADPHDTPAPPPGARTPATAWQQAHAHAHLRRAPSSVWPTPWPTSNPTKMDATEAQEAAPLASESDAHLVPLLSALEDFPMELMQRLIPADRAIMLGMVSDEVRTAMGRVKPAARVKGQASRGPASRSRGKCRARATKHDAQRGGKHGARKALQTALIKPIALLERGLGNLQEWCRVTALDLSAIEIGDEGAGRLATVLPQSTSLDSSR